jgi:hypothetical protein
MGSLVIGFIILKANTFLSEQLSMHAWMHLATRSVVVKASSRAPPKCCAASRNYHPCVTN